MPEVRERYLSLLRERATELKAGALVDVAKVPSVAVSEPAMSADAEQFLGEIAKG